MKKIYLSGKMTGLSEEEYTKLFAAAEKFYEAQGYKVINPVVLGKELEAIFAKFGDCKPSYEDYMNLDLAILKTCDKIAMLPTWIDSDGAEREMKHAICNLIPVEHYEEERA